MSFKKHALADGCEDRAWHMASPTALWHQLRITNSLEQLSAEAKRRTKVVDIFPPIRPQRT
ncbi:TPA: transposase [Pseudomonas putida]|nr:transposase [Pseudomonas putida]